MSDTAVELRRRIDSARQLQSVVRTMKAIAAASIRQYERSVLALADYHATVELGLHAVIGSNGGVFAPAGQGPKGTRIVIVFGSDQGLVGSFNELVAERAASLPGGDGRDVLVWAVGERCRARLLEHRLNASGDFPLPQTVHAIAPLVSLLQLKVWGQRTPTASDELYLVHNRTREHGGYETAAERVLPLDAEWLERIAALRWPTENLPETIGERSRTLAALIREYLFISLFRACAQSLASENASRLAAMQRAERNIDGMVQTLQGSFRRLRQERIDDELFDVVAGYEALSRSDR
jgi:F-type H+-transporting ATPase subunit gamma